VVRGVFFTFREYSKIIGGERMNPDGKKRRWVLGVCCFVHDVTVKELLREGREAGLNNPRFDRYCPSTCHRDLGFAIVFARK